MKMYSPNQFKFNIYLTSKLFRSEYFSQVLPTTKQKKPLNTLQTFQ